MEVRAKIREKPETSIHEETQAFQTGKTFKDQIPTALDKAKKPKTE